MLEEKKKKVRADVPESRSGPSTPFSLTTPAPASSLSENSGRLSRSFLRKVFNQTDVKKRRMRFSGWFRRFAESLQRRFASPRR